VGSSMEMERLERGCSATSYRKSINLINPNPGANPRFCKFDVAHWRDAMRPHETLNSGAASTQPVPATGAIHRWEFC